VLTDQPVAGGGQDTAVTPTELLIASLASCVAFYAGRFLLRHRADRTFAPYLIPAAGEVVIDRASGEELTQRADGPFAW
jgi:putative redox protein